MRFDTSFSSRLFFGLSLWRSLGIAALWIFHWLRRSSVIRRPCLCRRSCSSLIWLLWAYRWTTGRRLGRLLRIYGRSSSLFVGNYFPIRLRSSISLVGTHFAIYLRSSNPLIETCFLIRLWFGGPFIGLLCMHLNATWFWLQCPVAK